MLFICNNFIIHDTNVETRTHFKKRGETEKPKE